MAKVDQSIVDAFLEVANRALLLNGWTLDELGGRMRPPSNKFTLSKVLTGEKPLSPRMAGRLIGALELDAKLIDPFVAARRPQREEIVEDVIEQSEATGDFSRLRDEGITEKAIIRLAQRIANDTEDVGQAWLELQNAMDMAVKVQAEGKTRSNHGDFVDTVLARVAELSRDGDYAGAGAEIDDALAKAEAETARLLTSGIEIALLDRDTAKAATLLVRKADLDAGGVAAFEYLRDMQKHHYEIGRDTGSRLDALLGIDLAHLLRARATTPDERGTALNDLGLALMELGQSDSNTVRLEQAVTAYIEALKENTRELAPMRWAMTQMNLGIALACLGERDSDTARLEQAVTAFTEALRERSQDRVPMQWAMTQMNLGNALLKLGQRDSDAARLEQAVAAYTEALREQTRDCVPMDWAKTQMNLGSGLASLGQRDSDTARLEQAATAYTEALKENTRELAPMEWAATQMNLGNALLRLGQRDSDTARLEQAVAAYTEALKEFTRERVPMQWAMTQMNLASLEIVFFDTSKDSAYLTHAIDHFTAAREVFEAAQAAHYMRVADQTLAKIEERRQQAAK